jgi:hypothetical protein
LYTLFCDDDTPAHRTAVLDAAKELDKLMTASGKKAEARVGGFSSGISSSVRRAVAGGASLNDINNNLRLLVDGVRRLAEVVSVAVRALFACEAHG